MERAITMKSGADLLFVSMVASETLGGLYKFKIDAISQDKSIKLKDILGKPVGITMKTPDGYQRHYHGLAGEVEITGFRVIEKVRFSAYSLIVVPKPWVLNKTGNSRIFKNKSVPQIVRDVLSQRAGYTDVELKLNEPHPAREYCVQYQESDFDFISRLMQEEGIYYYFKHERSKHTMVLADGFSSHMPEPKFSSIPYVPPGMRGNRNKAAVLEWSAARRIETTRVSLVDYDYKTPDEDLKVEEKHPEPSSTTFSNLEVFEYGAGLYEEKSVGKQLAKARMRAGAGDQVTYAGMTNAVGLKVGNLFSLTEWGEGEERRDDVRDEGFNQQYLVVAAETRLEEPMYASVTNMSLDQDREPFRTRFLVVDKKAPYVVAQTVPRPRIAGYQTAEVYGKTDEEIDVDGKGRIEVMFHWSRQQRSPENHSRRVRVASSWAGSGWGAQHIPRIGQEVVVCFLDGNPDQPLVIGSVYNGDHKHPFPLPGDKTKSGVRSRSLRGGREDYNEIVFQDKKGEEELSLHAQRDYLHESERDERGKTGRDRTHDVKRNDTLDVGRVLKISAGQEIELKVGMNTLVLDRRGISLNGMKIDFKAKTKLVADAKTKMDLKAGMKLTAQSKQLLKVTSGMTMLEAKTLLSLEGLPVVSMPPPVPVVPPPLKIAVKLIDKLTDVPL